MSERNTVSVWQSRAVAALSIGKNLSQELQSLLSVCENDTVYSRQQVKTVAMARSVLVWPSRRECIQMHNEEQEELNSDVDIWKSRALAALEIADELARALDQITSECLNDDFTREQIKQRAVGRRVHLRHQDRDWAWGMIRENLKLESGA
jgi:hypothetical protein